MKNLLLLLLFLVALTPIEADSAEIITDADVNLGVESTYYENLYVGAGRSDISSVVNSDLTVVSGESIVSGKVTGDVFVAGGNVDFVGEADGDLRIIGGTVNVSGTIAGDLLVIGGEVNVSETATLLSDILLVGGKINFEGDSPHRLKVVAGKVYINGSLAGQSEVTTQSLDVGSDSIIDGNFSYYSPRKISETSGAEILGTVNYNQINTLQNTGIVKKTIVNLLNFWLLLKFITTLIIGFILVYVFRVFSVQVNNIVVTSFWKSLLAGLLTIIVLPIIVALFFISLVAMPVGFLLLITFISSIIIAPAVVGIFLGSWARKVFGKKEEYLVDFHSVTIGIILFTLLQFVPVIGGFLRFVLILVALGAMIRYIRKIIIR